MSYSIRPQQMDQVFATTRTELTGWLAQLAGAQVPLDDAGQGLRGSPTLVAQLTFFGEEHDGLARQISARTDSALHHGREAVDCYILGDAEMAEQYGRAAGAFPAERLPPDLSTKYNPILHPAPVVTRPPPVLVEGD